MLSRRTTKLISDAYLQKYSHWTSGNGTTFDKDDLYEFVYVNEFESWFIALVKKECRYAGGFQDFVLLLHTGESIAPVTKEWKWDARQRKGRQLLVRMAECYLNTWHSEWAYDQYIYKKEAYREIIDKLVKSLELDGYSYRGSKLLYTERDVLDHKEEQGILSQLYGELNLQSQDVAFHHLKLSEEHYLNSKWDDSISNSRKFLECVLMQVAAEHGRSVLGTPLADKKLEKPFEVRDYLEEQDLFDTKEKEAFAKVYGLLSHTGSHPNMAEKDQARLLRQLSLTLAQFVMLRLQGALKAKTP